MTKRKKISELENRVSALESSIKALFSNEIGQKAVKHTTLSYEEVISEWLNGKASKETA